MNKLVSVLLWPLIAIVGAFAFAALALGRGETVNAVWLVTAALSVYCIAYRYMRLIRPGRVGEASAIGVVLLLASLYFGRAVAADPTWGPLFTLTGTQLAWALILYGAIAASLPVWLMLAARDYLSTFLKIGTVVALAIGIYVVAPPLAMPAVTRFIDGTGPVFSGTLFPFLFITIACGSVSGFHSLISSGTTPKMIERESHMRFIGFGGMLAESFVAIMALTAACVFDPGIYFAMNAPAAAIGTTAANAAQVISSWGFTITPDMIEQTAKDIGENSILSRAGGAPTLAVGMAQILAQALGGKAMEAFWYHFAILFEALFILTAVDAGTRVGRFMIQDMLGHVYKPLGDTEFLPANVLGTVLCVGLWGYFLYQGVVDPLGGINTLWQLFGVGNQMLAGIALLLCTSVLVKMKREGYVWVTLVPTAWLLVTTLTAGIEKIFHSDPRIGFLALANKFSEAAAQGKVLAPAKSIEEMQRVAFNNYLDAVVCAVFVVLVLAMCVYAVKICLRALKQAQPTAQEIPPLGAQGAMA
jgi:carbon starvation protein CstA